MLLAEKADQYGYRLLEIPKYILDEVAVSSTMIRKALLASDIDVANKLLGYDFFFEGRVVKGDQLGREIGYPTANLEYTDPDKIELGDGVYAAYGQLGDRRFKGMLSIGNRPTLKNSDKRIEINLFDFNENIYNQTLRVIVKKYLRSQEKYSSLEVMKRQLEKDKVNCQKIL
jgi:riboflavin kinase / FMN adenylyltransferase